jgi:type I restriction enzyme S subunit
VGGDGVTDWRTARLDWLVTEERQTVDPLSLGTGDVFLYSIPVLDELGDGQVEPVDQIGSGKLLLEGGEVLVSKLNPRLTRVLAAESHGVPTLASTEFIALRPGPHADQRYLCYWLSSEHVRQFLDGATMSVTRSQQRVRPDVLTKRWVSFPPLQQQEAIADFLDAETDRIDALITKKLQLVDVLQARRLAATAAGVSGRLTRSHDDLAESPLPWLDLQPVDWRTVKLTLVARLGSGHTPSRDHAEWWEDCTVPWITTGEVAQLREDRIEYVTETREKISEQGIANSSATIHPAGTVVLSRTASAGFSAIMGTDMATSQDFATWTCGPLLEPTFLLLCLRAMRQDLLSRLAQGSTHKTIYMPDIESIRIPLPSIDDQRDVVQKTWRRLKPVDAAVDSLHRQIVLIHERRQALITAAVTGQVDIPGLAA